ncbi:TPA: hypothetical protein KDZ08_003220 [Vibrio parahaemolyticus]|nr:hypothetical protein [Vibrio parahaemolyticus]HBC3915946.1 hypothetical protein [Vibrio parahaemolyticus]
MDKLLASALEIKQRTMVTGLFAKNGFKIAMTDFDDTTLVFLVLPELISAQMLFL